MDALIVVLSGQPVIHSRIARFCCPQCSEILATFDSAVNLMEDAINNKNALVRAGDPML